jgi:hypothetical protein
MSSALNFNVFTAPEKTMVGERARPFRVSTVPQQENHVPADARGHTI